MKSPSLLTIAGSDSGGGAGVQADIKTFAACGVHAVCAITAVTSQNTLGVQHVFPLPAEVVVEQLESVFSDFDVEFAKTGMLYSSETIRAVGKYLKKHDVSYVVDPVMSAEAGGNLLPTDALLSLKDLIKDAFAVTPNKFEAETLTGVTITSIDDAKRAASRLCEIGAKAAVITGGHLDCRDVVLSEGRFKVINGSVLGGTHGAGCTYSAALTTNLMLGYDIFDAAKNAKIFVIDAISSSRQVGDGVSPVNQMHRITKDANRFNVLQNLSYAVKELQECSECVLLLPEVGCNIAMAIREASTQDDVAAVEGRIVRLRDKMHLTGCIGFGASRHVARIIISALRFNPVLRAAMNIRFTPEILDACNKLKLNTVSFSREDEPPLTKTMDWGTAYAFLHAAEAPDVIYDEGGVGKEAMIRLLGTDALSVAKKATLIARIAADA
ncbi:MAG: Bifunctional thiamine biosynthesis protein ThiDN [Candidatus Argoarchaeum ethanivorans]|uniref:Bifunctional thiamine biosynthesis protein ThiDN n=1 Tax=Candidatus Argoarchaeum ethanivorans TaxID=2608793 RepID=A0A811T6J5_9EURY|nr:MAG: Bifunctional thiamine biosynthesis protein ThiDN [Candidatus Argoarchaeum ethanivorans]